MSCHSSSTAASRRALVVTAAALLAAASGAVHAQTPTLMPAAGEMTAAGGWPALRAGIRQYDPGTLEAAIGPGRAKSPPALSVPGLALDSTCLEKAFPVTASGGGGVTWSVCVTDMGKKGLWVGPVALKRSPAAPWMQVLYQGGLADIYVPYHESDFRPYDMQYTTGLSVVTQQDAGNNGSPVSLAKGKPPTVVAEVRERGIAWLCKHGGVNASRRGEEFVVWGVSDAGNYDNIIQFSFRDDGTMAFRVGHTGYNSASMLTEAHMHTSLWRVDMDLNGADGDSAYLLTHREPLSGDLRRASDFSLPFNGGQEGPLRWNPLQLTTLLIEDNSVNPGGVHRIGYEFVHQRSGTARHYAAGDQWTQFDFYVTRYRVDELGWIDTGEHPASYLMNHIADRASVLNQDLVVWMQTAAHHGPTDEDQSADGGRGVTLVHWSGFNIEPHNLFAANPLGGPAACGQ